MAAAPKRTMRAATTAVPTSRAGAGWASFDMGSLLLHLVAAHQQRACKREQGEGDDGDRDRPAEEHADEITLGAADRPGLDETLLSDRTQDDPEDDGRRCKAEAPENPADRAEHDHDHHVRDAVPYRVGAD